MDYSLLIAYLRQKQYITDLEKDVLDTWDELQKSPFDRSSTQQRKTPGDFCRNQGAANNGYSPF